MSFENGIFIPESPLEVPAVESGPGTDTHRSSGSSGPSQKNSRSTAASTTNHRSFQNHKSRGGDYGRSRPGGSSRKNDALTRNSASADAPLSSLMQLTGLNSSYGDLNPNAPSFQPRNFQSNQKVNPSNFECDGTSYGSSKFGFDQRYHSSDTSRGSRNGGPRRQQGNLSNTSSSSAAIGEDYRGTYGQHGKNKNTRDVPRIQKQTHDQPNLRSPRKATYSQQPQPDTSYQRSREVYNVDDTVSDGYQYEVSDAESVPYYPKHGNSSAGLSRADFRDSNNRNDGSKSVDHTFRQSGRSNNWRSDAGFPRTNRDPKPNSTNEIDSWGETWEGVESEQRKQYQDKESGESGVYDDLKSRSTEAYTENVPEGKLFERFRTQLIEKKRQPDIRNQRETLSDQLSRNAYDCMICVEKVRRSQPIWSCQKCYNVFHLNCLRKWASSSADEVGWRCPGCQTYNDVIPSDYRCFCESMKNPQGMRSEVPHSCGQTCGRSGIGGIDCVHSCTIQCHPGPCPPCEALITRNCCCGKTHAQVKCSSKSVMTCENNCDKKLNCGVHICSRPCHGGECDPCAIIIKQVCYCGSDPKDVICDSDTVNVKNFSCEKPCGKSLNCGRHSCESNCHPGLCKPCKMSPEAVLSCPCGQTAITEVCLKKKIRNRVSCLDPILTCGKVCKKILPCGEPGSRHTCQVDCHLESQCPPCPLVTPVKCRCGNKKFDIPCKTFNPANDVLCEKKCTKKRNCGRHKCNTKCCIDHDHVCPIVCDRPLRCGNHNCSLLCHNGHCPPCRTVSFDELACECGATIIYPPVACGTKPAQCHQPCPRSHDCDHPVLHNCHSEPTCPPCTVLMPKWCNGNHDLRKNVMCHIKQVSCGMPCNKSLPCGRHKCARFCHPGDCHTENEICKLPCDTRSICGHNCVAPCHEGPCPEIKCKITTDVTCDCGRKKETMVCWKREKEYDRLICYLSNLEVKKLAEKKPNEDGESVPNDVLEKDENGYLLSIKRKTPKSNILECDKECARVERNRKMVEALQLEDPDVTSTFGTPNYTDFLVSFAKKNPQFVEMVHQRLTSLVLKARKSKRKNETYGFESMNRDKRHFVHEYSDHFGVLSESFDEEPNRNVICTASKEKSYCPSVNLIDAVFRPNLESKRKNAYDDVQVFQTSKSQIMRPANGKIMLTSRAGSGMVALSAGPTTSAWQQPNGNFPPLS